MLKDSTHEDWSAITSGQQFAQTIDSPACVVLSCSARLSVPRWGMGGLNWRSTSPVISSIFVRVCACVCGGLHSATHSAGAIVTRTWTCVLAQQGSEREREYLQCAFLQDSQGCTSSWRAATSTFGGSLLCDWRVLDGALRSVICFEHLSKIAEDTQGVFFEVRVFIVLHPCPALTDGQG